ncbi:MAG: hypothetical protein NTZ79_16885, partial [Proteobacteria bacterium]|nr:hypothetical protein [Pseudomonadota bacterium]
GQRRAAAAGARRGGPARRGSRDLGVLDAGGEELLPARDPERITLAEVLGAVRDGRSGRAMMLRRAAIAAPAEEACARVDAAIRAELGRVTLREFAARDPEAAP